MLLGFLKRLFGVKCYDTKREIVYYLWKHELDGSFTRAKLMDSPHGIVWIKTASLQQGDYKHPPFDEKVRADLRTIQDNLRGVYDLSMEAWEDGFRRDGHPDREIAMWLFFSGKFKEVQDSMILDQAERRSLFRMMVAMMNNGKEFALNNVEYVGSVKTMKVQLVQRFSDNADQSSP